MRSHQLMKEIEANLKDLASETDEVKRSDFFKNYLETMSKFWKYSYCNQMLIHFSMPEASRVAGFRKWQELNRYVKKGSKAIRILAPTTRKVTEIDPETHEEIEKEISWFFPVSVFDISQTEGEPLPDIDITIKGDDYKSFMEKLVRFCKENKIKLDFKNLGINGLYGYSQGGKVVIDNKECVNTQVNTLTHEIAHELLHKEKERKELSKQQKEIQAEATAYVVMKHFNMKTKGFNYLALYDADYKKIMENLQAVAVASKEIIEFISL